jgi:hypothetical protein
MGHRPLLRPQQVATLRRRRRAGWHPRALALAHGISIRSVYRYLAGDRPPVSVRIQAAVGRWADRRGVPLEADDQADLAVAIAKLVSHELRLRADR